MRGFQIVQFAQHAVVLDVRNVRLVQHVIAIVCVVQQTAEFGDAGGGIFFCHREALLFSSPFGRRWRIAPDEECRSRPPEIGIATRATTSESVNSRCVDFMTRCGSFVIVESDVLSRRPQPLSRGERGLCATNAASWSEAALRAGGRRRVVLREYAGCADGQVCCGCRPGPRRSAVRPCVRRWAVAFPRLPVR